jgi:copper(I)-binding protein
MRAFAIALVAAFALGAGASAQMTIDEVWATPSIPGQNRSAAYFVISNYGDTDRLVGVASDVATAELHGHEMDGDVARMVRVESVPVLAAEQTVFAPGGFHVMLLDLAEPLELGDYVTLTLEFEDAGKVDVDARVESLASHLTAGPADGEH